jgi:S-DNA-T family DNA segregation ATPase FtsK/SpoIIIE
VSIQTEQGLCRGCSQPVPPGYRWHRPCLQEYRRSESYRAATLNRDGYECTRCPDWYNRAVLDALARLGRTRHVEVDHIDPLGLSGTHDPTNLQVLCIRHHKAKTRRDLARMKGRPMPLPRWLRPAVIGTLGTLLAGYGALDGPTSGRAALVAAVLVAAVALVLLTRRSVHRAVLGRLRQALAPITGDSLGKRRNLRARRWRWVRIEGRWLPRLRPTRLRIKYPHTFADHDPHRQTEVEAKVAAKMGSTWTARWHTATDEVHLSSPDPLVSLEGIPWPNRAASRLSLWEPIPVGIGEDGQPVTIDLVGKNLLIGGEPGAGKSVAQSLVTATAALDPDVVLYGIDGKGLVELGPWRDSMDTLVGSGPTGIKDATDLLNDLRSTMDLRYSLLYDEQRRKVEPGDGLDLHMLVIDELALFTSGGTKAQKDQFVEALRDVISRGRAAGVIVVAATQRPSADVVPTQVRDLIGYRWAMRCSTPQSSDMVLGQGQASAGYSAAKVPSEHRGIGYLLAEGSEPARLRSYHVSDPVLHALAARAATLRRGNPQPLVDSEGTLDPT